MKFELKSKYNPSGSQPEAIKKLTEGIEKGYDKQTLLGITGSGKTFIISNVIQNTQKKTLVLAHNKILAAQLYQELKQFFPNNRVEYFISYYDYYQPESYIPTTDTYIEKEATINAEIEKLRLKTISALLSRDDVIVVASISCIYGAGNPSDFKKLSNKFEKEQNISKQELKSKLVSMLYERNDANLVEGTFRQKGETIDVFLPYEDHILRIEFFGDEIEEIKTIDPVTYEVISNLTEIEIYPAKQFAVPIEKQKNAIEDIKKEMNDRLPELGLIEAERLKRKVNYDIEMIEEMGYCTGIENYSRHFDNRNPGEPPFVLLDYFGDDFLLVIDESHQTLPQARAMYKGDYSRKKNLIDFGFRLPSAFDNRPLKFDEFEKYFKNTIFVSATPAQYEMENSKQIVESIIRPTGLLDPIIEIKPTKNQIQNLIDEINNQKSIGNRVLVTTLTKRMSEDLTDFLTKKSISCVYMHSEIDALERIEIVRELREGKYDVLIGINLLREGLDIPEVGLVAILDADKEGFLRNETSLIQTIGRAARNKDGRVIMYADNQTLSMKNAIHITQQRRQIQILYNLKNKITPQTIKKDIPEKKRKTETFKHLTKQQAKNKIEDLDKEMKKAAKDLDFEKAIELRDTIEKIKKLNK